METNFSKSHEEMQLERINTVAEPKGWWHKEVEELKQQLAAALATCKLKDEALERIRGHLNLYNLFSCVGSDSYDPDCADLNALKCPEIAMDALAIKPDDSALKAWLGEPVAYIDDAGCCWMARLGRQNGTPIFAPKGMK